MIGEARGALRLVAVNDPGATAGLAAGMALADARAILPGLRTTDADPAARDAARARLAGWCGRYSPWTAADETGGETVGGDASIWLDVTGCAHLFGGEAALLADLARRLAGAGLACRAALADTPGAAWATARYAAATTPWLIVATDALHAALGPLPVRGLRLDPATAAGLDALGLRRIADLLPLPRAALAARFGDRVARRLDQALGRLAEPISPDPPPQRHFAHLAFPEPVGRIEDIARALDRLLASLCAGLERAQEGARRLVLALYAPDGDVRYIIVGVGRANRDPGHLARLFADRLDGIEMAFGFDAITLAVPVTEALGAAQADLVAGGAPSSPRADITRLADRLSNRLGAASVLRLTPHESHVPERAVRAIPMLDDRPPSPQAWPAARPFAQPRPPRLLARPEPVDVVAPVPDDPPVLFRWRRVSFRVVRADGPERITPEWWLSDHEPNGDRRNRLRDYYRVEDAAGRRFWLYREGLYRSDRRPAWFLHGVFG